jgi:pimeloyl-ACP methyl ester carboxylesterase
MLTIDTLEKLPIGGVDQWMRIRSRDASLPVLLILYGGPGVPLFPRIEDFGERAGLEEMFTVVYWEQRGTGKSYSPSIPPASMTIDQFVDDIMELTDHLRDRFDQDQIALLGESWGTVIGLRAAARSPERFSAYVGTGQVVNMLEADRRSYEFALQEARRRDHRRALRDLTDLGPPPYTTKEMMRQRKWVGEFGGARHDEDPQSVIGAFAELFTTSEYSWRDVWNVATDPFFSMRHLLDELYTIDFAQEIPRVELPIYLLEGRYDYTTPTEVVKPYFEALDAPHKEWIWFENSAHFTFIEEPNFFREVLSKVCADILTTNGARGPTGSTKGPAEDADAPPVPQVHER